MTREETLFSVPAGPPKLTERQELALKIVQEHELITPVELGLRMGPSMAYATSNGVGLLKALRKKGLVRQRRIDGRMVWEPAGAAKKPDPSNQGREIPF